MNELTIEKVIETGYRLVQTSRHAQQRVHLPEMTAGRSLTGYWSDGLARTGWWLRPHNQIDQHKKRCGQPETGKEDATPTSGFAGQLGSELLVASI
jgi:hypothetical protein